MHCAQQRVLLGYETDEDIIVETRSKTGPWQVLSRGELDSGCGVDCRACGGQYLVSSQLCLD